MSDTTDNLKQALPYAILITCIVVTFAALGWAANQFNGCA